PSPALYKSEISVLLKTLLDIKTSSIFPSK
ncbi:unnamed protein product, partial [marine sediment metagenome]